VPILGFLAYNTPYQLEGIIEEKMKKLEVLIGYMLTFALSVNAQNTTKSEVNTEDLSCTNSVAFDLAYDAGQEYAQAINNIPGVLKIEIGTCSDIESKAVTSTQWKCGVFVWFENEMQREVFHQTTSLWGGSLKLKGGGDEVPVCSRTVQQLTSKGGPY
jgi:hypothetical protein